jgi:hypothetical protein
MTKRACRKLGNAPSIQGQENFFKYKAAEYANDAVKEVMLMLD